MLMFWAAAAVLSAAAASLMVRSAARAATVAPAEDPAVAVHRRQLQELDELADRGLLAEGELRSSRAEAGRRLLAAADLAATGDRPGGRSVALIVAGAAPLLATVLYLATGAPGLRDQPFAERVADWTRRPETLQPDQLAAVMQTIVAQRPGDMEALRNLAIAKALAGDPASAEAAVRRALKIAPNRADLAELLRRIVAVENEDVPTGPPPMAPAQMVARLAERLKAQPDDPEGWVRLVRGYAVLGDTAKRDMALASARARYAGRPDILSALAQAAEPPR